MNNENEILDDQEVNTMNDVVNENARNLESEVSTGMDVVPATKKVLRILVLPWLMFADTFMLICLLDISILTLVLFPLRKPVMRGTSKLSSTVILHFESFMDALTFRSDKILIKVISIILRILCRAFAIVFDFYAILVVIIFALYGIIPLLFKVFRGPVKGALKRWRKRIGVNIKRIFGTLHRTDYDAMIEEYEEEDEALFDEIDETNDLGAGGHVLKKDGTWDMRFKVNRQ